MQKSRVEKLSPFLAAVMQKNPTLAGELPEFVNMKTWSPKIQHSLNEVG